MNENIWFSLPSRSCINNLFQKMSVSTNLLTGYLQRDLGSKRNSVIILIYKKGDTNDPCNFRPMTLEPVALKVLTSLIQD